MLTGRKSGYIDDARFGDDSGYTNPEESEHDHFNVVGHTSTSISLATGMARARDLLGGTRFHPDSRRQRQRHPEPHPSIQKCQGFKAPDRCPHPHAKGQGLPNRRREPGSVALVPSVRPGDRKTHGEPWKRRKHETLTADYLVEKAISDPEELLRSLGITPQAIARDVADLLA